MEPVQIAFIIAGVIVFKIPGRAYRLLRCAWEFYRIKTMYHYLEYSYRGYKYHTRRSGPLNDLEGTGLKCQIKSRGGVVLVHINGTKDFVQQYINTRQDEINDRGGNTIDAPGY